MDENTSGGTYDRELTDKDISEIRELLGAVASVRGVMASLRAARGLHARRRCFDGWGGRVHAGYDRLTSRCRGICLRLCSLIAQRCGFGNGLCCFGSWRGGFGTWLGSFS